MSGLLQGRAFYTPLPAHLKMTLLALCDEANDRGQGVYIGQKRLGVKISSSDRSVRTNLDQLRTLGYLRRLPKRHPEFGTDQYEIAVEMLPTDRQIDTETGSPLPPEVHFRPEVERKPDRKYSVVSTGSPLPTTRERPVSKSTRESKNLPEGFVEWYAIYPRHVQRGDAIKAYVKALRQTTPDVLLAGAARLAADANLPETKFIPYPASWLGAEGWLDDPYPPNRNGHVRDRAAEIMRGAIAQAEREPRAALPGGRE